MKLKHVEVDIEMTITLTLEEARWLRNALQSFIGNDVIERITHKVYRHKLFEMVDGVVSRYPNKNHELFK